MRGDLLIDAFEPVVWTEVRRESPPQCCIVSCRILVELLESDQTREFETDRLPTRSIVECQ